MAAVGLAEPAVLVGSVAAVQQTVLRNVSWHTYECLLDDLSGQILPRLTYDRGTLEIMSPLLPIHERSNRTLSTLVEMLAEEWGIEYENFGSSTFKHRDQERGFEPDTSFYIQQVAAVRDKERIDLQGGDPPPDLIIEVDVTAPSLARQPIFSAVGVPEVWLWQQGNVTILHREGAAYVIAERSLALPRLTSDALNDLLRQSQSLHRLHWQRAVRAWARQQTETAEVDDEK